MSHYASLKKNFIAIEKKNLSSEARESLFESASQAIVWEDGFFLYLKDPKQSFVPDHAKHLFLYDSTITNLCHGCKDRLKFTTTKTICAGCVFHASKKYSNTRFNEKGIMKKLEELGFKSIHPRELYNIVLPSKNRLTSQVIIDKGKIDSFALSERKGYFTIPYWRFGTTNRFLEVVNVRFRLQEFENESNLSSIDLRERRYSADILLHGLSNHNDDKKLINEVIKKIEPFLYEQEVKSDSFPIQFYSHTWENKILSSQIDKVDFVSIAIKDKNREYYAYEDGIFIKCDNSLNMFLSDLKKQRSFIHGSLKDNYVYDGVHLYKKVALKKDIRFTHAYYNDSIEISFSSWRKDDPKTLREAIHQFPKANKEKSPIVYCHELLGEEELEFHKGDKVCIISPVDKNKKLINATGEIISVNENNILVGFLNNHFTELFNNKEIIKIT